MIHSLRWCEHRLTEKQSKTYFVQTYERRIHMKERTRETNQEGCKFKDHYRLSTPDLCFKGDQQIMALKMYRKKFGVRMQNRRESKGKKCNTKKNEKFRSQIFCL